MRTSRRIFIAATGAALYSLSRASAHDLADSNAAVRSLLTELAEELLRDYPENATALGIDTEQRSALKGKLSDRSAAGQRSIAERAARRLERLRAIDDSTLDDSMKSHVDVIRTAHELALEGFAFSFGDTAVLNQRWSYRNTPYVVAQNAGAFFEIPGLLDALHSVQSPADAEAYLSRMEAYAHQLDGETERLRAAAAKGVIAPVFLLHKTLQQMAAARRADVASWPIVTSLSKRTQAISGSFATQARRIAAEKIAPALDRQLAELKTHQLRASADAGVWKLPGGDAYYAWALKTATTTRMTPEDVHDMGREELTALHAQMDTVLKRLGLTQGTVGERMTALGKQQRYRFSDDEQGRARLLAYLQERVSDIRTRVPDAFATLRPGLLQIKRLPVEVESGAPGAYGGPGTLNGEVPSQFWINLGTMSNWTTYNLATLTYHEAIPGHAFQGESAIRLPLFRSLLAFNAFGEGWALYAEQLAAELGVYEGDDVGRLGYLQSVALRACRLIVDTGLHAKRWTREQAIHWFASTNGSSLEEVTSEVDRYCAWPGQACGYKVGHSEINRLRTHAQRALGSRFDVRSFNDALVKGGDVPMTVLARSVENFIARQAARE